MGCLSREERKRTFAIGCGSRKDVRRPCDRRADRRRRRIRPRCDGAWNSKRGLSESGYCESRLRRGTEGSRSRCRRQCRRLLAGGGIPAGRPACGTLADDAVLTAHVRSEIEEAKTIGCHRVRG